MAAPVDAVSAASSSGPVFALRMESSKRRSARLLLSHGRRSPQQVVDLGGGGRSAPAGLENTAPLQNTKTVDRTPAQQGGGDGEVEFRHRLRISRDSVARDSI